MASNDSTIADPDWNTIHQVDFSHQANPKEEPDWSAESSEVEDDRPVGYWCEKEAHSMCLGLVIPELDRTLKLVKCECDCHR